MPRALSVDLAWRVVWKRLLYEQTEEQVASDLLITSRTVSNIMRRFNETGHVETRQGERLADPHNKCMTFEMDMKLLEMVTVLDDKSMLQEIAAQFSANTGVEPHISSICRGFSDCRLFVNRLPTTSGLPSIQGSLTMGYAKIIVYPLISN